MKRAWNLTITVGIVLLVVLLAGPNSRADNVGAVSAQTGCQTFQETGKTVCGRFLEYWQTHGGLAQQGYPISNVFVETSDLNGMQYQVQYFERSVFELHTENQPPNDVLLSQLGTFQFKRKYPNGDPSAGQVQPTQPPAPTAPPAPRPTNPPATGPKLELADYTVYKPEYGGKRAAGYIKNSGSVDLARIQVIATFKNATGSIVGTNTDDCGCVLRPGDFYPFLVAQSSSDPEFASVEFQLVSRPATDSDRNFYYNDFAVSDVNVVPPTGSSSLKVLGTVKNTGNSTGYLIEVNALITDAAGKTIDVESTFTEANELGPGQSSPFEIRFDHATTAPNVKIAVYSFRK